MRFKPGDKVQYKMFDDIIAVKSGEISRGWIADGPHNGVVLSEDDYYRRSGADPDDGMWDLSQSNRYVAVSRVSLGKYWYPEFAREDEVVMGWAEPTKPPSSMLQKVMDSYENDPARRRRDELLAGIFAPAAAPAPTGSPRERTDGPLVQCSSLIGRIIRLLGTTVGTRQDIPVSEGDIFCIVEVTGQGAYNDLFLKSRVTGDGWRLRAPAIYKIGSKYYVGAHLCSGFELI